ncbi:hypothetical protein [Haloarcula salinisoli]|uniref:Uncharacterized protein n=1 Tax=Haloarcula salinisoli TaxID=2487746 RepID=A0A8J7YMK3_9EURY|nr:hypothetical protein [Halomicroarcula salinisoli]MBX0286642.1 hypothetical protein [Halomicroarcula salinisoli]MBX0303953.1 hypothetical protein [Halomicroarcula salinisoli]
MRDYTESVEQAMSHAIAVASGRENDGFDYEDWQPHAVDPRTDRMDCDERT